jgi:hypothetical protein
MAFAPTSPVTGSAVTGLTSPTYTLTADTAPTSVGKQYAVTTLGGTQTGVRTHSISSPFTITWFRDPQQKQLPPLNQNGQLGSVPMVKSRFIMRVGLLPLAGQAYKTGILRLEMDIPAGSELADTAQLKAAFSLLGGVFGSNANAHYDSISTGVI